MTQADVVAHVLGILDDLGIDYRSPARLPATTVARRA